ncbi:uncharacterized protein LOC130777505 isoform X1 [Actinidia eriantha]|uniref:uncharacterized protein LOC130777505 isoform X1 n=1 Tax=Actinidia eriantha TaxID=165200 RepID=UPI002583F8AC|nr:uncharacterized protein LOC130777505 isoform X1 [Actinidia eriantha]XP_057491894.1 uncharacterized protein LOC130777505 isoform X1 [Actinidia eriantha]
MGKTNTAMLGLVHEELTEDNYEYWKVCLERYLISQGLWDVVSEMKARPAEDSDDYEDWRRKNALALHAIQLSCGPDTFYKFRKTTSAKEAWEHLAPSHLTRPAAEERGERDHLRYETLYKAIEKGNWKAIKSLLDHPYNTVRAKISSKGDTPLHVAILDGHIHIAEKLVNLMSAEDLEITNEFGNTALSLAAINGSTKLAKIMVNKNPKLVTIENDQNIDGHIPVIVAALYNRKHMVHYLYDKTPIDILSPEKGDRGATLLHCLITAEIYDVALQLLDQYPKLGLSKDRFGKYTLRILTQKPSAFPSGSCKLVFWKRWIYSCITIHPLPNAIRHSKESFQGPSDEENTRSLQQEQSGRRNAISEAIGPFREQVSDLLKILAPDVYHRKLVHREALKILGCICKEIPKLSEFQLRDIGIDEMIHDSIKLGIFEFIDELIKCDPSIIWRKDSKGRTIFSHAIVLRQAKIFSLIHGFGTKKSIMAHRHDIFGNNYLHLAAKLSPPTQLEHVSGAALQMQKELQWFKEVENMVQPKCREELNEKNKTPSALFTDEHKELAKDGERWMKNTAASGMVVGTLIAAVMFTTAFTVPGGNNDTTGLPIFLKYNEFLVFVVSNALSMFCSSTSVLMFLGILTARYEEKDFFRSLPMKVIIGLSCLFLSIVTMMVAFGAAIYITLHQRLVWVTIPIIVLAVIPITLFCVMQFPLLVHIIYHTYVSGI